MAAWRHYNKWDGTTKSNGGFYKEYRDYVAQEAPKLRKSADDCADLSIRLLIDFAASHGLPVTFRDVDGWLYISKARWPFGPNGMRRMSMLWLTSKMFTNTVQQYIQVKSLWNHNTIKNPKGPQPGDLMMKYTSVLGYTGSHHTALVFADYPSGKAHLKENDSSVPDFPGKDIALAQSSVTEYFMGTLFEYKDTVHSWELGTTRYRHKDSDAHFDYLNSRGEDKRNAELIYYANARQLTDDGFEFRNYNDLVLDNWGDWTGEGDPQPGRLDRR